MLRHSISLFFSAALLLNLSACNNTEAPQTAASGSALLRTNNCMGCHKMEGKLVGPGFSEIARKYAGDATAEAKLEAKVATGGSGVWGTMPMPPMVNAKAENIKTMVAYILAQAK